MSLRIRTGYALCKSRHGGPCSCEAQKMKPCVDAVAELGLKLC